MAGIGEGGACGCKCDACNGGVDVGNVRPGGVVIGGSNTCSGQFGDVTNGANGSSFRRDQRQIRWIAPFTVYVSYHTIPLSAAYMVVLDASNA